MSNGLSLTAFQWPSPGGSVTGDLQHEGKRCRKESAGLRGLPLIGSADATTLREPLQALAESWPLRPR